MLEVHCPVVANSRGKNCGANSAKFYLLFRPLCRIFPLTFSQDFRKIFL